MAAVTTSTSAQLTMSNPKAVYEHRDSAPTVAAPVRQAPSEADEMEFLHYEVRDRDTLERIAAQYDTTPTAIMRLNRLSSRMIFTGQKLRVPNASKQQTTTEVQPRIPRPSQPSNVRISIPGPLPTVLPATPGVASTTSEPATPTGGIELDERSQRIEEERFVKIEAKRIAREKGVVTGTFLVTPNVVMFDPNVSDPLVLEYGMERFSVIAYFDTIRTVALYPAFPYSDMDAPASAATAAADQRPPKHADGEAPVSDADAAQKHAEPGSSEDKHEQTDEQKSVQPSGTAAGDQSEPEHSDPQAKPAPDQPQDAPKTHGTLSREHTPPGKLTALVTEPEEQDITHQEPQPDSDPEPQPPTPAPAPAPAPAIVRENSVQSFKYGMNLQLQNAVPGTLSERTNALLANVDELLRANTMRARFDAQPIQFLCVTSIVASCTQKKPKSEAIVELSCCEEEVEYWFAVPKSRVEDLHAFFANWIPRSPHVSGDKPAAEGGDKANIESQKKRRSFVSALLDRKNLLPRFGRSTSVATANSQSAGVAPSGLANANASASTPTQATSSDARSSSNSHSVSFALSHSQESGSRSSDTESALDGSQSSATAACSTSKPTRTSVRDDDYLKEWEILNVHARARHISCPGGQSSKALSSAGSDFEMVLTETDESEVRRPPSSSVNLTTIELTEPSNILTETHLLAISRHLPARSQGYAWTLTYSTETHGFSLRTLYRRQNVDAMRMTTPNLLVLTDTEGRQFGAFCSDQLLPAEHFFGTGECFIFTFVPEFRVYHWSGENNYFIKCSDQSLVIGSSYGHNALWLDQELNHGRTQSCETFHNEPLTGDSTQDFVIKTVEVWAIQED